jgi:IS4 transposase
VRVPQPEPPGAPPLDARLILVRLAPETVAAVRRRLRRKARKKGYAAGPRQLRGAAWLALLTTLDRSVPADEVLALDRLRWQVELAFKRMKSQLRLDDLQAKEARLARATLLAKLILAALSDQVLGEALALSPSRPASAALPLAARQPDPHRPAHGAPR